MKKLLCAVVALVFLQTNVMAAAPCLSCNICYRCTNEDAHGCCLGPCVYDENYCQEIPNDCIECLYGYECSLWLRPGCCGDCQPIVNEDCENTAYRDPITKNCVACPLDMDCISQSDGGNGGISSCYLEAKTCQKNNKKGTYEFSSDCFYTDFEVEFGGNAVDGGDAGSGDLATEEDEPV